MSMHLLRDLEHLQDDLLSLAESVEEAVLKSIQSLHDRDAALAREVVQGDSSIDQEEIYIEEECLKMLALHQPVAEDLRRVAAIMNINNQLERMADLAEEIAERSLHLLTFPALAMPDKLQRMADLTTTMVRQSIDAFVKLDTDAARRICRLDDEVNRFNRDIIAEVISLMKKDPDMVEPGLSLFSATRHLERIADHATNIAEDVVYIAEGEIIRHKRIE